MLCGFGLINMNGRVYDPYVQRFLSADNFIQSPDNAQSYNRYSYCLNNPLKYTDPTGWNPAPQYDETNGGNSGGGWGLFPGENLDTESEMGGDPYASIGRGGIIAGSQGYVYVGGGSYQDIATGKIVAYSTVYSNYVVPNSITFNGQLARNFVTLLNNLGPCSVAVNGNQVIIEHYSTPSDLLASNDYGAPATELKTGTQFFSGTLGALTLEGDHEGKEGPGLGMSGAYYRGNISLDGIFDLSTNSLAGYNLNISASFISATEESLSGKVGIIHNGYTNSFTLSPSREAINRSGYKEIGSLSFPLSSNTFYLHVQINISLNLNGPTFNPFNRTFDENEFNF